MSKIFLNVDRLVKAMRDYDLLSLHQFMPSVPVCTQRPIYQDFSETAKRIVGVLPAGSPEKYTIEFKGLEGWRVYNKDAITWSPEGALQLRNTPRYTGVAQSIASKEYHSYGQLMVWMKWGTKPQDGADESFGFADPDHIGGFVTVRVATDGLYLIVRDLYESYWSQMKWRDEWMNYPWLWIIKWTPYNVRVSHCSPFPRPIPDVVHVGKGWWEDYVILNKLSTAIPKIPLDLVFNNYDNKDKVGETALEIHKIEYYPLLGGDFFDILTPEYVAKNFEIRDTASHWYWTDPEGWNHYFTFQNEGCLVDLILWSTLNQDLNVTVYGHWRPNFKEPDIGGWSYAFGGCTAGGIGNIPLYDKTELATKDAISNVVVRKLTPRYPYNRLELRCTTAPTTGNINIVAVKSRIY